jgi:hypothetical protein
VRWTLLLHYPELTRESAGDATIDEGMRAFSAYAATLHAAGVLVHAEVLEGSGRSATVREVDGRLLVQDGPFADTREQLGGTFVLDVPDRETALHWAAQAPAVAWGAVEVRPGATHTVDGVWQPNG